MSYSQNHPFSRWPRMDYRSIAAAGSSHAPNRRHSGAGVGPFVESIAATMENWKLSSSLARVTIGADGGVTGRDFCGCGGELAGNHNWKPVGFTIGRLGHTAVRVRGFGRRDAGVDFGRLIRSFRLILDAGSRADPRRDRLFKLRGVNCSHSRGCGNEPLGECKL